MKFIKKITVFFICVLFLIGCVLPAAAKTVEGYLITVDKVTAVPGDNVTVNIDLSNNSAGVMAMTFSISYDKDALSYVDFHRGVFNDYLVQDHPDKGYLSFVNCESMNRKYNGTILSVEFKVKDKAAAGFHEIKIRNIYPDKYGDSLVGCFANWAGDTINATAQSGGVTVGETCSNTGHKFSDWLVSLEAGCVSNGIKNRTCTECGHNEIEKLPKKGHSFNDFWTIDTQATATQDGYMTRHCANCDATTDTVAFSLADSDENKFENKNEQEVKPDKWEKLESIIESPSSEASDSADSSSANDNFEDSLVSDDTANTNNKASLKDIIKSPVTIIIGSTVAALAVLAVVTVLLFKKNG